VGGWQERDGLFRVNGGNLRPFKGFSQLPALAGRSFSRWILGLRRSLWVQKTAAIPGGKRRGKSSNLQLTRYLHPIRNAGTARDFSDFHQKIGTNPE
jgi:hypothetical protein